MFILLFTLSCIFSFFLLLTGLFLLASGHRFNALCWRLLVYAILLTCLLYFSVPTVTA